MKSATETSGLYLGIGNSQGHLYAHNYNNGYQLTLDDPMGTRTLSISEEFYQACIKEFSGRFGNHGCKNILRWLLSR
jgi:hypothetical protein